MGGRTEQTLGETLRALRQARGMSVAAAARLGEIGRGKLQHWEADRHAPSTSALVRLLDALESDARTRSHILSLVDSRHARLELVHSELGAPVDVGTVLRAMRHRRGITQVELARRVGVAQGTLAKWESGNTTPSAESVHALGYALGASAEEIVALAAALNEGGGLLEPDVEPEEADRRIAEATSANGPLKGILAAGYHAETWRRALRDRRWNVPLCRAISARAVHDFMTNAPDLGWAHATQALRLAKGPKTRLATVGALDIATEVIARRRRNPAATAALVGRWVDGLPDGPERALTLWMHSTVLATIGQADRALDAARHLIDLTPHSGTPDVIHRVGIFSQVYLAGGEARRALDLIGSAPLIDAHRVIAVKARHALGEAAHEDLMEGIRRERSLSSSWYHQETLATLERRQARLLDSPLAR